MKIEKIDINKLKPAKYNPRKNLKKGDIEFEKIKKSILEFGYVEPIICNKDFTIIGGHQRFKVLQELKYNEIDVVILDLDKTKEKALNIALNKISGEWDMPLLKDLLQEIDTGEIDIELTGFDFDEIENLMSQFNVDDENEKIEDDFEMPEENEIQTDIKIGDLFEIGKHRLLCGDSTDKEQVEKLMNGEKAEMVFTDPPYGVSYTGGVIHGNKINKNHKREMLKNDDIDLYADFIALLPQVIDNGPLYIFYATRNSYQVFKPLYENKIDVMAVLAWVKINTGYADMNSHYKNRYEPCIYAKIGKSTNWIGPTDENTTWEIEKDKNNKLHPTQKPISVPLRAIKNHKANLIFDFFLGSGSTMVASHQLKRKCYGMELDPKYCQVIIDRMKNLDSDLIIKKNGIVI